MDRLVYCLEFHLSPLEALKEWLPSPFLSMSLTWMPVSFFQDLHWPEKVKGRVYPVQDVPGDKKNVGA